MNTILFFISSIVVILGLFALSMYLTFNRQLSDSITFAEMEKCEEEIAKHYNKYAAQYRNTRCDGSLDAVDIDALTKELHLKIEQAELPSSMRGVLKISESPEFNGIIQFAKVQDKQFAENFDIMHEIVHYLRDVGVGKRVGTSFARTHHGNPRSHQEQITDYYAAAMAIPKESLENRIRAYHKDPYDEKFIAQMMEVYQQPKETILRRIDEVISLS